MQKVANKTIVAASDPVFDSRVVTFTVDITVFCHHVLYFNIYEEIKVNICSLFNLLLITHTIDIISHSHCAQGARRGESKKVAWKINFGSNFLNTAS